MVRPGPHCRVEKLDSINSNSVWSRNLGLEPRSQGWSWQSASQRPPALRQQPEPYARDATVLRLTHRQHGRAQGHTVADHRRAAQFGAHPVAKRQLGVCPHGQTVEVAHCGWWRSARCADGCALSPPLRPAAGGHGPCGGRRGRKRSGRSARPLFSTKQWPYRNDQHPSGWLNDHAPVRPVLTARRMSLRVTTPTSCPPSTTMNRRCWGSARNMPATK